MTEGKSPLTYPEIEVAANSQALHHSGSSASFSLLNNKKTKVGSDPRVHQWRTEIQDFGVLSTELINYRCPLTAVYRLKRRIRWAGAQKNN